MCVDPHLREPHCFFSATVHTQFYDFALAIFFLGFAPLRIDRDTYLGTPFVVIREGVPEPFILKGRLDSSTPRVIAVVILAPDLVRRACPRPYRLSSCKKVC